jgi:hypothetical protein
VNARYVLSGLSWIIPAYDRRLALRLARFNPVLNIIPQPGGDARSLLLRVGGGLI